MAEITTSHFEFIETAHTGSGIPGFRILNPDGEEIGQVYFSLRDDLYKVEIAGTIRLSYSELHEITEFVRRLRLKVGVY